MDWWKSRGIAILSGIFGLISAIAELVGGQAGGYAFASLVAVRLLNQLDKQAGGKPGLWHCVSRM